MIAHAQKYAKWYALGALFAANFFIWHALLAAEEGKLTVAFLDIGQGDAIFIEAPGGNQVVIDGGPDASLLRELPKVMPAHDRSIDVLIVTNPDKDHFAGFVDVLRRYRIGTVILPATHSESAIYQEFENAIAEKNIDAVAARRGMEISLGASASIKILFPDRDVSKWKSNDGSTIAKLVYGETSVFFTGDATKLAEGIVVGLEGGALKSDILKVGHHGSRTSTGAALLRVVQPTYAVISAGARNSYGHPHPEVIEALKKLGIETHVTAEEGTIVFESDGKEFVRK